MYVFRVQTREQYQVPWLDISLMYLYVWMFVVQHTVCMLSYSRDYIFNATDLNY